MPFYVARDRHMIRRNGKWFILVLGPTDRGTWTATHNGLIVDCPLERFPTLESVLIHFLRREIDLQKVRPNASLVQRAGCIKKLKDLIYEIERDSSDGG